MEKNKLIIHTDGGARGNPGPAAIGVVIEGEIISGQKKYKEYIGVATNNVAEYRALILALEKARVLVGARVAPKTTLTIHTDSELICRQISGEYRVKDPDLKILYVHARKLIKNFGEVTCIAIPRDKNITADRLVNDALDERG